MFHSQLSVFPLCVLKYFNIVVLGSNLAQLLALAVRQSYLTAQRLLTVFGYKQYLRAHRLRRRNDLRILRTLAPLYPAYVVLSGCCNCKHRLLFHREDNVLRNVDKQLLDIA